MVLETKILLLQQNTCENKKQRHNIQVYNLPTTKPRHQAEASYMVQFVDTRDMFVPLVHTPSISKCESCEHDHTILFDLIRESASTAFNHHFRHSITCKTLLD